MIRGNEKIVVLHSHGYLPIYRERNNQKHFDSIVLTTDEYFKNYDSYSSFGYKSLFNHLNETCYFVGNSISDYEEQKVLSSHFRKYPSRFNYCYCSSKDLPIEAQMYKTIFLIKIGVIPLWYGTHNDYVEELYKYAEALSGKTLR